MFGNRFFAPRFFADGYFPPGGDGLPPVEPEPTPIPTPSAGGASVVGPTEEARVIGWLSAALSGRSGLTAQLHSTLHPTQRASALWQLVALFEFGLWEGKRVAEPNRTGLGLALYMLARDGDAIARERLRREFEEKA